MKYVRAGRCYGKKQKQKRGEGEKGIGIGDGGREQILTGGHGRQTFTEGEALSCQVTRECVSNAGNWWCRHPKAGTCLGPSGDSMSGVCDRVGRRKGSTGASRSWLVGASRPFPSRDRGGHQNTWKAFSREMRVAIKRCLVSELKHLLCLQWQDP